MPCCNRHAKVNKKSMRFPLTFSAFSKNVNSSLPNNKMLKMEVLHSFRDKSNVESYKAWEQESPPYGGQS